MYDDFTISTQLIYSQMATLTGTYYETQQPFLLYEKRSEKLIHNTVSVDYSLVEEHVDFWCMLPSQYKAKEVSGYLKDRIFTGLNVPIPQDLEIDPRFLEIDPQFSNKKSLFDLIPKYIPLYVFKRISSRMFLADEKDLFDNLNWVCRLFQSPELVYLLKSEYLLELDSINQKF